MSQIELTCGICGTKFKRSKGKYNNSIKVGTKVFLCSPLCRSIFTSKQTGKANPNYKHGKYIRGRTCIDCGGEISIATKHRCHKCNSILSRSTLSGQAHYNYGKSTSQTTKDKISNTHIRLKLGAGRNNPMYGKLTTHSKGAYYNGIYMRSTYEIKYAKYLDNNHIKYKYEPNTFEVEYTYQGIKKEGTYTPDFYLPETNEYIEIKGWWRGYAKPKFEAFKEQYKDIKIKLLMRTNVQQLGIDIQ